MLVYEIRDPVHGFIQINEWERQIINDPVFQRLRRIRQLAWTDMVYPGACHNRFEHSLGVMHVATKMFDSITRKEGEYLKDELNFSEHGLDRDRTLLRLACLLHDVGHSPFSHAGEGLLLTNPDTGKSYKHEHYSAAAVRYLLKDSIENNPLNENYHITAEEVAQFLEGSTARFGRSLLWRDLLSSQLDADRADYLLRDSYHCGVTYGHYDINRLLSTVTIGLSDTGSPILSVEEGGIHVAEALILARYQMFTQVYFQHTRRAYDHHIADVLKILLEKEQEHDPEITIKGKFPPPTSTENTLKYLHWDDWKVYGLLSDGQAGEPGELIKRRNHYRCIHQTHEVPTKRDMDFIDLLGTELDRQGIPGFMDNATSSWYKTGKEDILIRTNNGVSRKTVPLSSLSSLIQGLKPVMQQRIYVPQAYKREAKLIKASVKGEC
ncbi:deoxyguanosinetriphosphate triphosphohydrolase [Peptococcaceae bacterium CEB3]|nr:deoxyguanosinetriphosphate triphosphohydrolase [Peptococcaceae bacterium CEB3]